MGGSKKPPTQEKIYNYYCHPRKFILNVSFKVNLVSNLLCTIIVYFGGFRHFYSQGENRYTALTIHHPSKPIAQLFTFKRSPPSTTYTFHMTKPCKYKI